MDSEDDIVIPSLMADPGVQAAIGRLKDAVTEAAEAQGIVASQLCIGISGATESGHWVDTAIVGDPDEDGLTFIFEDLVETLSDPDAVSGRLPRKN